ncbi:hypothetical protein [Sphingobium algorifonticola]|uniref:Uncharacterized protein n=1 Tax=Sphingobium algorifonticola TaxID=2008318 RepID=A0A437J794_9SPHN|nr:hypothetical protein [Sphingobium algorifonticola]RVT41032.1 hypothetical protein ENE74_11320 [Sphingobium algorifonticola]
MAEPKPFASLTSGLLARKGAAVPAMRRQVMLGGNSHHGFDPAQVQDDLGWNDMGEDQHRAADAPTSIGLTPMGASALPVAPSPIVEDMPVAEDMPPPPVVEQRRTLAERVQQAETSPPPVATAPELPALEAPVSIAMPARSKAAFTLRLDPERHLRLRLACAVGNRSAQQIVTQALDAFLDSQPQIEALADQLPRPCGKTI